MKKLIKRTALFVAILFAMFVTVSFMKSNSSEKEVLLVEMYASGDSYGVSIIHSDKPTEFIEIDFKSIIEESEGENQGDIMRKLFEKKGKIFRNTLQKLYDDGWRLEGTNGGDGFSRYILTK